jgi:hypothetical protein
MADKLTVTSIRPDVNSIRTRGTFELVAEALDRIDGNVQRTANWVNGMPAGAGLEGPAGPAGPPGGTGGASGKISYEP